MAKPEITDLTEAQLDGEGAFDKFMAATKEHICTEFKEGRITGGEYSTVYLNGLQTAWGSAIQFVLQRDQAALIQKQIELAEKDLLIKDKELEQANKQIELINKQIIQLQFQNDKLEAEKQMILAQTLNIPKEGLVLDKQLEDLTASINLKAEQLLKIEAEKALIDQKLISEKAQTDSTQYDANSVIGTQVSLYEAQINGYANDNTQKVAKTLLDTWAVRRTTDTATQANIYNHLTNVDVGKAVENLLGSIGETPATSDPEATP